MDSKADKLRLLGDPSGQQNSDYWNKWFGAVCTQDHTAFEWYCDVDEVVRVLKFHLSSVHVEENAGGPRQMIHPGSGTSLCPLKLLHHYPRHKQVVLDISEVAIKEMREVHDKHHDTSVLSSPSHSNLIQYEVADVLNPPLPFESSSFDVWLDKGFIDAVFSKDSDAESTNDMECQPTKLFDEAHRLLTDETGILVIITLAETHSLNIILNAWLVKEEAANSLWHPTMNIWELAPISGELRPYGFVLAKKLENASNKRCLKWHYANGCTENIFFQNDRDVFDKIPAMLEKSRDKYKEQQFVMERQSPGKMLITIEVKPVDTDAPLNELASRILSAEWHTVTSEIGGSGRTIHPLWVAFENDAELDPAYFKIVPVGYGICKLQLKCVIVADDIDDFVDSISEWTGADEICEIQSIDVVDTVPVLE